MSRFLWFTVYMPVRLDRSA